MQNDEEFMRKANKPVTKPRRVTSCSSSTITLKTMDPRRESARLRGIGPELTLLEAGEVILSLSKKKKGSDRRRKGGVFINPEFDEWYNAALVPLPANQRSTAGAEGKVGVVGPTGIRRCRQ